MSVVSSKTDLSSVGRQALVVPSDASSRASTAGGSMASAGSSLDYVAEYDYFTNLRKAHLDRTTRQKREEDAQRRQKKREEALQWRQGGRQALHDVTKKVHELRFMLQPHHVLRESMTLLLQTEEQTRQRAWSSYYQLSPRHSSRLLSCLHETASPPHNTCWSHRTNLIMKKMELMRQIRHYYYEQQIGSTEYCQPIRDWDVTRKLHRMYSKYIPISKEIRETLRKKRDQYRFAKNKLDLIYRTITACKNIAVCKSIQHYNAKGCGNCGVIFVGGSLAGAIPYVKSVSRDTGVATLVTLEFEFETLAREEEIQVVLVAEIAKELQVFEEESVYKYVRTAIQFWWSIVLAYRRMKKQHHTRIKSMYYHRIRRLSLLKREVDTLTKERPSIDIERMKEKYVDIIPQMLQYLSKQEHLKSERILQQMQHFHKRLVQMVLEARERRRQEEIRLASLPKPDPPIRIKTMRPLSPKKLVCYRQECQMRKFLTIDRYETHMSVHEKDDELRYQKYAKSRKQKKVKLQEEKFMLKNIEKSKEHLSQALQDEQESLYDDEMEPESDMLLCYPTSEQPPLAGKRNKVLEEEELSIESLSWTDMPHRYTIYGVLNASRLSLELVSKHSSVLAENKVVLDQAVTRVGTHFSCELPVKLSGETERFGKISKIHCLIYHGMATVGHEHEDDQTHMNRKEAFNGLTIVDNSSLYGTYVVGKDGALKVSSKVSKGMTLTNGSLICIGLCKDGPPVLPVTEASSACLVYRLQYA